MLTRTLTITVLVALSATACRKKQPEAAPTPPPTPTQPDTAGQGQRRRQQEIADSIARANAERERRMRETATLRETLAEMVFFDYDRADIRDEARPVLDRKVPILRANAGLVLRIEGHADERGSVEYNLALSLRRANAARDYLVGFGIPATQLNVVPMGEERPFDAGTSEDAYQRNRRAEFHIVRGADTLVPPR